MATALESTRLVVDPPGLGAEMGGLKSAKLVERLRLVCAT